MSRPGSGRDKPRLSGLYVLTDERLGEGLEAAVAAALAGGAQLIQYRDKSTDHPRRKTESRRLCMLTHRHGAVFIVNDDPELAAHVEADGVHLGRGDPDIAAARRMLGPDAVIGVSCYDSLDLARAAVVAGADYIAFGSVYPSPTKPGAVRAPLELLTAAKRELAVPVCAIGGITADNANAVRAAGADMLAVISSVLFARDVVAAARAFAEKA